MELEESIGSIKERMIMNQMPQIGNLWSTDKQEIRQHVRAIQALLSWKETKSVELRQGYQEKLRRVTGERESFEAKCQKLEQKVKELDKQAANL